METTGSLSDHKGETMLNIFPNPCKGDTFFYTDDPEAAWVCLFDPSGHLQEKWSILPGKTIHVNFNLATGTYHLVLQDHFQNPLGLAKPLFISDHH